ncbi:MAG: DinB family protein [Gemmatimonadota bacterium]|nr:DinB family protein [Gemmatimonadota bacterium]
MLRSAVQSILKRDIAALRRSVEAYPDDASVWAERPGFPNVGGTLVLHLAGNLQHFVGAVLGKSGYKRDRDAEFARRGVSREALLAELDAADRAIDQGMAAVSEEMLAAPYPIEVAGRTVATGDWLIHLTTHCAYHLGQLDYHRRSVTRDQRSVNAVATSELPIRVHERAD